MGFPPKPCHIFTQKAHRTMKRLFPGLGLAVFFLATGPSACAQAEPQVIVVPPDEMSRQPSLGPSSADSAPSKPATVTASLAKPVAAAPAKHSYNSCNVDGPYIAITFDDGPHAVHTPKLLDMLKQRGLKATFYVVGQCAAEYPDIMKRIAAEGHEIGNHSWSHVALNGVGADSLRKQMENTNAAIAQSTGLRPATMRPPYGATSARLNKLFDEQYGMKVILWSVDPLDWKNRNAATVSSRIIQNTHPGAIILAHDIHATTVAAMPEVFDTLTAKGYKFVTVSELLAMDRPPQLVKKETPAATPAN